MSKEADVVFAWFRATTPFFIGGAEKDTNILAARLARRGYRVTFLGSYAHPRTNSLDGLPEMLARLQREQIPFEFGGPGSLLSYSYMGVRCVMAPQEGVLAQLEKLLGERPTVIITGQEQSDRIVRLSREHGVLTAAWIQSVSAVGLVALDGAPDCILCLSKFIQSKVASIYGRSEVLLYPPFDPPLLKVKRNPTTVTFVNPVPDKGVDVFIDLSQRFTQLPFLAIEGWYPVQLPERALSKNVRYLRRQDSLDEVFADTRVLLVPSRWEEGFGRVVVEAGLYGVPSIATRIGGLVEACGDSGMLVDGLDPGRWSDALEDLLDEGQYDQRSAVARAHAERFLGDPVQTLVACGVISGTGLNSV